LLKNNELKEKRLENRAAEFFKGKLNSFIFLTSSQPLLQKNSLLPDLSCYLSIQPL